MSVRDLGQYEREMSDQLWQVKIAASIAEVTILLAAKDEARAVERAREMAGFGPEDEVSVWVAPAPEGIRLREA